MDDFLSNLFSETNRISNLHIQLNHGGGHKIDTVLPNGNKNYCLRSYKFSDFYDFLKEVEKYTAFLVNNENKIRKISIDKHNLNLFGSYVIFINSYKELAEYQIFAGGNSFYNKVERLMDNLVDFIFYIQMHLKNQYMNEVAKQ